MISSKEIKRTMRHEIAIFLKANADKWPDRIQFTEIGDAIIEARLPHPNGPRYFNIIIKEVF